MKKILLLIFALLLFRQVLDAQTDTVPPVLICKHWESIGLGPLCFFSLSAADFIDTVYDNSQSFELGIRKTCTGTGFPPQSSIMFYASEQGYQSIEIWARDMSGNTTSCAHSFFVGDGIGNCDALFGLRFVTDLEEGIDHVWVDIEGVNCLNDSLAYQIFAFIPDWLPPSFMAYYSQFGSIAPSAGYNFQVSPSKNETPLNGVTPEDLTHIYKHLLGIEPFSSPYQIIAADANQDGKVTTLDILILRRLTLGLIDELPHGKSWRFVPYDYIFPNPQNPFASSFPEKITVINSQDPVPDFFSFKGVKIGDVDFTADPK